MVKDEVIEVKEFLLEKYQNYVDMVDIFLFDSLVDTYGSTRSWEVYGLYLTERTLYLIDCYIEEYEDVEMYKFCSHLKKSKDYIKRRFSDEVSER